MVEMRFGHGAADRDGRWNRPERGSNDSVTHGPRPRGSVSSESLPPWHMPRIHCLCPGVSKLRRMSHEGSALIALLLFLIHENWATFKLRDEKKKLHLTTFYRVVLNICSLAPCLSSHSPSRLHLQFTLCFACSVYDWWFIFHHTWSGKFYFIGV